MNSKINKFEDQLPENGDQKEYLGSRFQMAANFENWCLKLSTETLENMFVKIFGSTPPKSYRACITVG